MKASYNWLKQLVPGLTASATELATRLTQAGLEVEAHHKYGEGAKHCEVVCVRSMRPHPSKSGLRLVTVDRGGAELEIVCGAPNVPDPGGLVVLAPLGAHLPAKGLTITKRDIGGVPSVGMLVSESELGLSDDGDGIIVLPPGSSSPGAPFAAAFPEVTDDIFEINVTPNRGDCLGHVGLAREIAALYGFEWRMPQRAWSTGAPSTIESLGVQIRVDSTDRCPRYAAMAALDVAVGPSPTWLRYRLSSLGVRSISNVVDVTNLVMLEYGHPMHAFDLDKLAGAPGSASSVLIHVRNARAGETMVTLDGVKRTLTEDDLLICDGAKPIALAGVMGGKDTEVNAETKRVLFEVAVFDPRSVRRTARRHALHSESSHRFERGVDLADTDAVLAAATEHTAKLAGAQIAMGKVERQAGVVFPKAIRLRSARVRELLGMEIPFAESVALLQRLGCTLHDSSTVRAEVVPPSHRHDIAREEDLIEEIIRVRGMDLVPEVLPAIRASRASRDVSEDPSGVRMDLNRDALESRVREACIQAGLSEAIVLGMTSVKALADAKAPAATVTLQNPLSENGAVMRTSLLPGLLDAVARAKRHEAPDARLFALGRIFRAGPGAGLPIEELRMTAVLGGHREVYLGKAQPIDVWDAKGVAMDLARRLTGVVPSLVTKADGFVCPAHLHPNASAAIAVLPKGASHASHIGTFGLIHPDVTDAWDIAGHPVAVIEFDVEKLDALGYQRSAYRHLPKFPANTRDLALVVRQEVAAGAIASTIRESAGAWAEDVFVFDRFEGSHTSSHIPDGCVSLAFRVLYRAEDRTLTDAEVDGLHKKVITAVEARYHAAQRA
jgi:phenylalanyl-tRNA synthetase beta chain